MAPLPLILALLLTAPAMRPAQAQTPVCDAASVGIAACIAGKLCACGYEVAYQVGHRGRREHPAPIWGGG